MTLHDRLKAIKSGFEAKADPEILAKMHRATEELERSDILERVRKAGDRAPDFTLNDTRGGVVGSRDLYARGPLVVTFYRGSW